MNEQWSEPTEEDKAAMDKQAESVLQIVRRKFATAQFERTREDLDLIQVLLTEGVLKSYQKKELQCLGIVLGNVLEANTPLRWVMVSDMHGRDPALLYPGTTILVFPLTMISKRFETGQEVNVNALFDQVMRDLDNIKRRADRATEPKKPWWKFWDD